MLAAMVSRAPVRVVSPENTATHMSVRSYLIQLCGYFRKNGYRSSEHHVHHVHWSGNHGQFIFIFHWHTVGWEIFKVGNLHLQSIIADRERGIAHSVLK